MIVKAIPCPECRKYSKKKQESLMHLQNKHFIKLYMPCLWLQFQDEMLHKKTFTKKHLILLGSKFKISIFQTSFTKSKTLRNER